MIQKLHTLRRANRSGFSFIELLVVITVIAILAAMLLPGLSGARTKTARCASNMRQWATVLNMYISDNADCIPYMAESIGTQPSYPHIFDILLPYMGKEPGGTYNNSNAYNDEARKCPGGSSAPEPFGTNQGIKDEAGNYWNCWIGVNYGRYRLKPLGGMFYYRYSSSSANPAMKLAQIRNPSDAMTMMDTLWYYVYSPAEPNFKFNADSDGDGMNDTVGQYKPFSHGRPTVHNNGANVALLDGHVERVAYKKLWNIDAAGNVTHSFWWLED